MAKAVSRDQIIRRELGQEQMISPVQLTTSRIGNYTRLIHTLLKILTVRQRERKAEEAAKVEVAPGLTIPSLRRLRAALVGPTQGLPKRRRLRRKGSLKILRIRFSSKKSVNASKPSEHSQKCQNVWVGL